MVRGAWWALVWFTTLCLSLHAVDAIAHDHASDRRMFLQVNEDALVALVFYELPASDDVKVLRRVFDHNHDGVLSEAERAALAHKLARDATALLQVERDQQPLGTESLDWELEGASNEGGSLLLVLHLVFDAGGAGRYSLQLKPLGQQEIKIEAEAGEGFFIKEAITAPSQDRISVGPLMLHPGDALWFVVEAQDPSAGKQTPRRGAK